MGIETMIKPPPIPANVQFGSPPIMALASCHPIRNPPVPLIMEEIVLFVLAFVINVRLRYFLP